MSHEGQGPPVAMVSAAAAIRWDHSRVRRIRMLLAPWAENGVSEVGVEGLQSEPSAREVAGVEPFTEQHAGCEVGADAAGAMHAHRAPAGRLGDLVQLLSQLEVGDVEGAGEVALGILGS